MARLPVRNPRVVSAAVYPGRGRASILAGADPLDAVLVQVVVMFLVLASAATTSTVMAVGVARRLFTVDHRLADASTEPPAQAVADHRRPLHE